MYCHVVLYLHFVSKPFGRKDTDNQASQYFLQAENLCKHKKCSPQFIHSLKDWV